MKIVLWIVGSLIGLVALVALVGTVLPKGHVARRSIVLRQPPDSVWAVITNFPEQPKWRKDVTSAVRVSDGVGGPVWREEGRTPLSYQTTESAPPRRLVRTIVGQDRAFGGRWVYELTPQDGGTKLTITEEGEVYNPIFRFVGHFFLDQAATIESYLTALATHLGDARAIQP